MDFLFNSVLYWVGDLQAWVALGTLVFLEIILGIDNLIFLAIIIARLPESQRDKARIIGLCLAMLSRIVLLVCLFWIMKLTTPLFHIADFALSGRDIVLFLGGSFLVYKATGEIHAMTAQKEEHHSTKQYAAFGLGMVDILPVMIIAIVVSVLIMLFASKGVSHFIESNPSIKTLALAFLILVGVMLIADSAHFHIPRGYIYFAIIFSLGVEILNIYFIKSRK